MPETNLLGFNNNNEMLLITNETEATLARIGLKRLIPEGKTTS